MKEINVNGLLSNSNNRSCNDCIYSKQGLKNSAYSALNRRQNN